MTSAAPLRVAVLLSCDSFERFFGQQLGLTRSRYAASYRNDWVWEYADQLERVGVEVVIMIASFGPDESVRTADGRLIVWVHQSSLVRFYERAPILARTPPARWLAQAVYTAALLPSLRHELRRHQIDVLYLQEYWTGRFDLVALMRPLGLPLVAGDHGGTSPHQLTILKRIAFSRAITLTSQTEDEAQDARRFGARVSVLGNAVDTAAIRPALTALPDTPIRLLHVARLVDHHKRTSLVIRSLTSLPGAVLDIVGSGPDGAAMEALASELGVEDRVVFHGFVTDRARIWDLYRAAHVLVQPSHHEARLLAALEAMACGTPVVLSDIDAFRAILVDGRGGRIVPAEPEPERIAHAVREVVAAGSALREEARDVVEQHHSWSVRRSELADLLRRSAARIRDAV